jgi:hypothetical protein
VHILLGDRDELSAGQACLLKGRDEVFRLHRVTLLHRTFSFDVPVMF